MGKTWYSYHHLYLLPLTYVLRNYKSPWEGCRGGGPPNTALNQPWPSLLTIPVTWTLLVGVHKERSLEGGSVRWASHIAQGWGKRCSPQEWTCRKSKCLAHVTYTQPVWHHMAQNLCPLQRSLCSPCFCSHSNALSGSLGRSRRSQAPPCFPADVPSWKCFTCTHGNSKFIRLVHAQIPWALTKVASERDEVQINFKYKNYVCYSKNASHW